MHKTDQTFDDIVEEIAYQMFDAPKTYRLEPYPEKLPLSLRDVMGKDESWDDRVLRMLRPINDTCKACTMCDLGREYHSQNGTEFDPHVLSNMRPSKWVVVGQNPGFNECIQGEPFVGQSGDRFNREIESNGLSRDDFYITNSVKCHTDKNAKPSDEHVGRCKPFLEMEFGLLRPKLVITLGAVALDMVCPGEKLSDNLGKVIKSEKFGVKVYPIYHPSPMNMSNKDRLKKFKEDIRILCKLIKKLK